MTSRARRTGLAWLVAPVAAGSLAIATDWTLHHPPAPPGTAVAAASARPSGAARMQHRARAAARRLALARASLLHLETSLQRRSAALDRIEADLHTAQRIRLTGRGSSIPTGGAVTPPAPVAPLPRQPVAVPAAPPVSTTTRAS